MLLIQFTVISGTFQQQIMGKKIFNISVIDTGQKRRLIKTATNIISSTNDPHRSISSWKFKLEMHDISLSAV